MRLLTHLMLAMTIMPLALAPQASAQEDTTSHMITYIEVVPAAKAQAATLLNEHAASAHAKQFRDKMQQHLIAPIDDRLSIVTTASPIAAATGAGLYVVTHVDVAPPNRDKIIVALKALADPTRKDKGNVRYDVLQQKNRTNHF